MQIATRAALKQEATFRRERNYGVDKLAVINAIKTLYSRFAFRRRHDAASINVPGRQVLSELRAFLSTERTICRYNTFRHREHQTTTTEDIILGDWEILVTRTSTWLPLVNSVAAMISVFAASERKAIIHIDSALKTAFSDLESITYISFT